ncbi:ABC transporter substrate-binding protein [Devosia sp. ZW T5_3]|uniref:ABC transporter substrate-binding protein n=1 Tax=Devosia sp. ZW T5_3 TaxID=3378085 RepID=UPI0038548683
MTNVCPSLAVETRRSPSRKFLWRSVASVIALTVPIGALAVEFTDAPVLQELVAAGSLPPVEERLPANPEVINPLDELGSYGGTLRFGLRGSSDHNHILRMVSNQGLVRWNPDFSGIVPNLAERWEVDPDAKVFTFHLRAGLKWSDGQPFTADDVMFNMEDLVLNDQFAPTPSRYTISGEPVAVVKVDDLTVRFTFAAPYGGFLSELAAPLGQHPVLYAKHYCSQFHPDYNDDIDALVKENGLTDWQALFLQKCGDIEIPARWGNPDRPTMDPWVIATPYSGGSTSVTLQRNPFFWQVDTEGKQLPYIDTLSADVAQDVESLLLSVIGGNIDFALRHIDDTANRPLLAENQEAGDYHLFAADPLGGTHMLLQLNLTHKNPELRELFNEKNFRVALSLGIDRQTIIDTVLLGASEPWQQGDFEGSDYYHEQLSTQYLQYDPAQANALLDSLGLTRGADGMRNLPSGRPLRLQVDVIPTNVPDHVDQLELISQQWAELGVDLSINSIERTFFFERAVTNYDHDMAVWRAAGTNLVSTPEYLAPVLPGPLWAVPWGQWYTTGGAEGEEPPESIKQRMQLWDDIRSTADDAERVRLFAELSQAAADEFEVIGVSKAMVSYGIVKNNLINVPETMPSSFIWATPGPALPQTWFFKP